MPEKFKVQLVTPRGMLLDKEVEEIIAPGIVGEFGVLAGHTPLLTFIKPGVFSYLEADKFIKFAVGSGFCEVLGDSVTVLVEEAYPESDIDGAAAASELRELEGRLKTMGSVADAAAYGKLLNQAKVARAKVSVSGATVAGH